MSRSGRQPAVGGAGVGVLARGLEDWQKAASAMTLPRAASGAALVALAASVWGLWPLFLRPGGLPGVQCAFIVLLVMALPALVVHRRKRASDRGAWGALVLIGFADALNCVLYFAALQRGPVAVGVLTHYLAPLIVTLLAPLLIGEARSRRALIAAPLSLLALAVVIGRPDPAGAGLTALLGAGSAVGYATIVLATQRAARLFKPLEITSLHATIALVVLLVVTGGEALPQTLSLNLLPVFAGAALCGLAANVAFNVGLARAGSQVSGALTYLEPLGASIVGWLMWNERLGPLQVAGGVGLLVLGAWVALEPAPALTAEPNLHTAEPLTSAERS